MCHKNNIIENVMEQYKKKNQSNNKQKQHNINI